MTDEKRKPGRPPKYPMPEPIPDSPENVARDPQPPAQER